MAIIRKRTNEDKELKALENSVGTLDMSTKNLGIQLEDLGTIIKRDLVNSITKLTDTVKTDGKERKKQSAGTKKGSTAVPKNDKYAQNLLDRNKITASVTKLFDGLAPTLKTSLTKMFGQTKIDKFINRVTDKATGQGNQKFADYKELRSKGMGAKEAMGKTGLDAGQIMKMSKGGGKGGGMFNMFGGGKNVATKALSNMGPMIARGAGMLMKAAGPIGAAFSIGMEVVDYFDSGKAAQSMADVSTFFSGAGANTEGVEAAFKDSKQYRKMVADFNLMEPLKEEFAQRRDMMDWQKGVEQDDINFKNDKIKDEYNMRFTKEKAWMDFGHQQAMQNMDAQHARRKTLFMTGMGDFEKYIGIGERALTAIGSSTEAVLSSITSIGKNLGASIKDMIGMSAAAAGLSKLLGSSAEDVLSMGNMFRLMNKTSLEIGTNLTAGIKAFADKNGVMASVIMKDMTDSSAEIYKFSDGTAENFAKQAVQLNKMGTSMSAMMKASDSMVLNYKDSIKAEMSLSAMLGQNVDLSETRAKLMSGDQAGAAESLRNSLGGQDVGAMNAFQKQQLSQATGMDIDQLMSLQQGGEGGVEGTLDAKNAKKTGADIANGALRQDIANEGAKLAADLAHQEEMMKEEQRQRKGMLFMEQAQRLQNLAIEAKWRIKYAKLDSEQALAVAVKEMQVESASKLTNNLFQDSAQSFKDNLTKSGVKIDSPEFQSRMSEFSKQNEQSQKYVLGLVQQGILTADNAGMAMADIAQKVANGEKLTTDGVNKLLNDQNAFGNAQNNKAAEIQQAQADLEAFKKQRAEEEVGFWGDVGDSLLDGITLGFSDMDEENDKLTDDNAKKQQEMEAYLNQLKGDMSSISHTVAESGGQQNALATAQQELAALQKQRAEEEPGFWGDIGDSLLDGITFGWSTMDDENDKLAEENQKREDELKKYIAGLQGGTSSSGTDFVTPVTTGLSELKTPITDLKPVADNTYVATAQMMRDADTRGVVFKKQYDYQAKVSNETTKATYAVAASIEALAASQGKPISLDTTGVASAINRLQGVNWAAAQ
jgi:hypothetical protein